MSGLRVEDLSARRDSLHVESLPLLDFLVTSGWKTDREHVEGSAYVAIFEHIVRTNEGRLEP